MRENAVGDLLYRVWQDPEGVTGPAGGSKAGNFWTLYQAGALYRYGFDKLKHALQVARGDLKVECEGKDVRKSFMEMYIRSVSHIHVFACTRTHPHTIVECTHTPHTHIPMVIR